MRVLSVEEQHRLCDILMQDMNLTKFGVLLCMYTGIRIGEVCALKWESIDFRKAFCPFGKLCSAFKPRM